MIIGEIPEDFRNKFEELKNDGFEIVYLKDTDDINELKKPMKIGIVGLDSHFLHEEMLSKDHVEIIRMCNDEVPFAEGSFESLYGKPSEIIMKISPVERFDFDLSTTTTFEKRNKYKKREYKLSAGTRYKPNKKRK